MKKTLTIFLTLISLFILSGCDLMSKKEDKNKEQNNVEKNETNNDVNNEVNEEEPLESEENNEVQDEFTLEDNYLINNRTKEKYEVIGNLENISYDVSEISDLYVIKSENGYGIYNNSNGVFIKPKYTDISCIGHTLDSHYVCTVNSDITILTDNTGTILISLKDGEKIVSGDKITELPNGKFIVKKDNNEYVYNTRGNELLKSNFIGYSEYLGYISINNSDFTLYDEEFKKIDLPNIDDEIIISINDNSSLIEGDVINRVDIKDNKYFSYDGQDYSGKKIVIVDPCKKENTYIIEDDKAIKLNNITYKDEDLGYICH